MKKIVVCLIIALLLVSFFQPAQVSARAAEQERYGYSLLTNAHQRTAYQAIAEGIGDAQAQISFTISGVTQENVYQIGDDIKRAAKMVLKDYPEYFWYTGGFSISFRGDAVTFTPDGYRIDGGNVSADSAKLRKAREDMDNAVADAMKSIPKNASDYEIALALHDYVANHTEYIMVGDHQTAYGSLVKGKAVCAGYARAYQMLLNKAGIRCTYIAGESYDPDGNVVAHAWNLVWLDGKCYYTDVTWDDQGDEIFHEYLNLSKKEIGQTHFTYTDEILPPSCGHEDYRFFIKNAGNGLCDIRDYKDDADVAECFELKSQNGNNVEYYCTIHYHGNNFATWFNQHSRSIANKLGLGSYRCEYIELGHEHHVTYTGVLSTPITPPTQPSVPSVQPSEPAPSTNPSTPPTQPVQTPTQPSQSATEPSAGATEPTVQPTNPVDPTNPTEPVTPTEPSQPSAPSDATNPSQNVQTDPQPSGSDAPTDPSVTDSLPQGSDAPSQSDTAPTGNSSGANDNEDNTVLIVIVSAVVVIAAGAGVGSFLVIRKKKM